MAKTAVGATQGLAKVKEIYQDRYKRIREVRAEGKDVFGYLCIYPPLEMLTAFDIVPFRIFGDMHEPITEADDHMTMLVCPFIRSCLDLALKGKYDFLNGTVFARTCDIGAHMSQVWKTIIRTPNPNYIFTPKQTHQPALEFHKILLENFQNSLETFAGKKLTPSMLKKAIKLHNQQRALVRELYDLRKSNPPLLSGVEALEIVKATMSIPIEEGNQLLKEAIGEIKQRKNGLKKKGGRILIWGTVVDDTSFLEMIESLNANVVMDDICVGSRAFYPDVPVTDEPLDGINQHYLVDLKCPRTLRETEYFGFKKDHMADLETRFSYLKNYIKDWKVNGVVLQAMRYCDIHAYEIPDMKDYLDSMGIPSIYLEQDYSEASLSQFKTRVEGFLELIAQKG